MKFNKKVFFTIIIGFLLVIFDLLSKCFFFNYNPKEIFITPILNKGIAWSIPVPLEIIFLITVFTIIFLIYFFLKNLNTFDKKQFRGFIFILSGSIGNLIDRIIFGGVRDFIDFKIFPIFNFADIWISIGTLLILLSILPKKQKTNSKK